MTDLDLYKTCCICRQNLPANNNYFVRKSSSKDGLTAACKACYSIRCKRYRLAHLEAERARIRSYGRTHKERKKTRDQIRYKTNKEQFQHRSLMYYHDHKQEQNHRNKIYCMNRIQRDEGFSVRRRLRCLLAKALQRYSQEGKTQSSSKYGINFQAIIEHLGPCPGNRKDYHIDHIKPLKLFNLNDPAQIKEAFAPANHRWLLAGDNIRKKDTWPYEK